MARGETATWRPVLSGRFFLLGCLSFEPLSKVHLVAICFVGTSSHFKP
jgi:hypothetical protein